MPHSVRFSAPRVITVVEQDEPALQPDEVRLQPLISHVLPVDEAAAAFRLLDETPEQALQVVLKF